MRRDFILSGEDTFDIMNMIKPGDIILRSFNSFKKFFLLTEYFDACVYVGKITIVRNFNDTIEYENLISYLRCDEVLVLRLDEEKIQNHSEVKEKAIDRCHQFVEISNTVDFDTMCNKNFEVPILCYKELGFLKRFDVKKLKYRYDDYSIVNSLYFKTLYKKG